MATIKFFAYLNKPAAKSQRFVLIMGLGPSWCRIGSKTCFIPKVSKFYVGKGYLCQQASKFHHCQVNVYFTGKCVFYRLEHKSNGGPLK